MAYDDDHTNYGELFLNIKTALSTDRKVRQALNDRYLRDYSAAWGAQSTENGGLIRDDYIPESYAQECINLAHGLTKHPVTKRWVKETNYVQVRGTSYQLGKDENGYVTLRGPGAFGGYQFTPDEWTAFLRVALSFPVGTDANTTAGFGGQSSNDLLPEQKRVKERNEEVMRQWSIASSKSYPKGR